MEVGGFYGVRESFVPYIYDVFMIEEKDYEVAKYPFTVKICEAGSKKEILIRTGINGSNSFIYKGYKFSTLVTGTQVYGNAGYWYFSCKYFTDKDEFKEIVDFRFRNNKGLEVFVRTFFNALPLITKLSQEEFDLIREYCDVYNSSEKKETLAAKIEVLATETEDKALQQRLRMIIKEQKL